MSQSDRPEISRTSSGARRRRAPTITIDTSAGDHHNSLHSENNVAPELRPAQSFDSKQSRPVSSHNVSSPTSKSNDGNFLSVPGSRSRQNSFDSDDGNRSPSSYGGETFYSPPSSSAQGDRLAKSVSLQQDNSHITRDEEALKPDPGTEADFDIEDNKFAFSPGQLTKLFNPKSLGAFYALGGLSGLEKGLRTNCRAGLSMDEGALDGSVSFEDATMSQAAVAAPKGTEVPGFERTTTETTTRTAVSGNEDSFIDRRRVFGDNRIPERKAKNIFQLAWMAYNDKILILLTVAAVISLALGLYETFGQKHDASHPPVEWVEGVAIIVAILIVVVVGAANDWQKERQFVKLNKKKEDRMIKLVRSGKTQEVSIYDVLAGDVLLLEPGDMVPVDGILIEGHNVKCDESSATGESDLIKKSNADDVYRAIEDNESTRKMDPFIISGAKVTEGVGRFLVTGTGIHSSYGKTMMSLREESEPTPLQSKLNVLAEYIAKLGGAAALLLFVVLFIKFLVQLRGNHSSPSEKGQQFLQIFIVAVTIVVVAVPEGLPLAVTLALAFATTRMLKDNNLVRVLRACETMGNATAICSDKTGTLTQNKMTVVAGTLGTASRFGDKSMPERDASASLGTTDEAVSPTSSPKGKKPTPAAKTDGDDVSVGEFVSTLHDDVKELVKKSVAINSTAFEGEEDGSSTFIGSKTETALLHFARDHLGMGPLSVERSNVDTVQVFPFDSGRKCMASVIKLDNGRFRMYVKGASEIMLSHCTKIIADPTAGISETSISKDNVEALEHIIQSYASRSLRTLGLLYRDFQQWPPSSARTQEGNSREAIFDDVFKEMIFLGVIGIQDPLRDGVADAVFTCQKAGVFVRMVTGDNILTARAIAQQCGIFTEGGLIMEGPKFRKLSKTQLDQIIPRLQVLARSSPEDKRILVRRLKELGETVAVTGDGTNDAPALKSADVGFSMGIAGTEVAKEASAIILMDDNFTSIVKAMMWGRAVNDSVKKFLQFQLTVNITAVLLAFVSAVASKDESSVLTAVQLLWVNLIMDTFAALALATDPPSSSVLDRKPDPKSAPLISVTMWKMIIGQAIYQLVVTFILYFGGVKILSYQTAREQHQLNTLVFNTFVWMQIFNELNNRRLDNHFNIFEGVFRNYFFIVITLIMIAGQVMIVFVGGRAFSVTRLNGAQWAYSIILGALSIPVGIVLRLIPDELILKAVPRSWRRKPAPQLVVSDDDRRYEFSQALEGIREDLVFLKKIRGGRLNALKFKLQHPREALLYRSRSVSRSGSSDLPRTPTAEGGASDFGSLSATPDSRNRRRGRSRSNSAFGPAAAMAGIIAGSVAGWSPIERSAASDDGIPKFTRSRARSDLESQEGVEVHPSTKPDDPIISEDIHARTTPPSQRPEETPNFHEESRCSAPQTSPR
ncbi:P-type calcium ATPase [Xylona heveae TC161]|uniref:Calcium-transporting ATPase n=1 Tax=Xylona heveae (strain CBS 132557 / TC161) TaxID=1328760 RepID=A0A165JJS7_XYLHT|nr:P-type calcium ATPase [Xylona heveae TC161]KZF26326.1 P-type calcium ATPase [Xylona heveae TC161]